MATSLVRGYSSEHRRATAIDEIGSAFVGLLVAAVGIYGVIQIFQGNPYSPPVGERVIQGAPINPKLIPQREPGSDDGEPVVICAPSPRQTCT